MSRPRCPRCAITTPLSCRKLVSGLTEVTRTYTATRQGGHAPTADWLRQRKTKGRGGGSDSARRPGPRAPSGPPVGGEQQLGVGGPAGGRSHAELRP